MKISPTLAPEEFVRLHNGLCSLHSVQRRLEDVLNPMLMKQLNDAVNEIRGSLSNAYAQEKTAYTLEQAAIAEVEKKHCFVTIWSVGAGFTAAEDFNKPAFAGLGPLKTYSMTYEGSEVLVPPSGEHNSITWLDLWKAADNLVRMSGDLHHRFIEGFYFDARDPKIKLSTGS
jgi:hypothetical protein